MAKQVPTKSVRAIRVAQWLSSWNHVQFDPKSRQSRPEPAFHLFALRASELRALTGIYRRSAATGKARAADPNVQRAHDEERSGKIRDFVKFGYPWCELSTAQRESGQYSDLRKPGWLPTAVVVNILRAGDRREGEVLSSSDAVTIEKDPGGGPNIRLPKNFSGLDWRSGSIPPLEVIDGQHRLWAFEGFDEKGEFELPVVAFDGLDRSWQAYLFWSINITPKRIKQSLAFDLYPLLRTEDWLERFEGHSVYRESRAQELVEALWSHPESPWKQRINMLGDTGVSAPMVSQAAWIRSLLSTFVKGWEGHKHLGGLFGAPAGADQTALPWTRAQQAACLIAVGISVAEAVRASEAKWAENLRNVGSGTPLFKDDDAAFYGQYSLLSTDQGIRGLLCTANDILFIMREQLKLASWTNEGSAPATDEEAVSRALKSIRKQPMWKLLNLLGSAMASWDWRTSSTPKLDDEVRRRQGIYRGSSGYKELRRDLLMHLRSSPTFKTAADQIRKALDY